MCVRAAPVGRSALSIKKRPRPREQREGGERKEGRKSGGKRRVEEKKIEKKKEKKAGRRVAEADTSVPPVSGDKDGVARACDEL
jgi:hypothetical protein